MGSLEFSEKYYLLFKTGDAELRALDNFMLDKSQIFPIVELTRGRKSKKDTIGIIEKRLTKIKEIFNGTDIILDLTANPSLSNQEIDELYDPNGGYQAWIDFLTNLKREKVFKSITPTILVNTEDPHIESNLEKQVKSLAKNFQSLCYRNNLKDDGFIEDLNCFKQIINSKKTEFLFVFDCEYISAASWSSFATRINSRIKSVRAEIPSAKFVICATSFPKFVTDVGDEESYTFQIFEIDLHDSVLHSNKNIDIFYGDYGSINPERNDGIVMSRGWRPRIDVPLQNQIFYYRLKKGKSEYSEVYVELASNYVVVDKRYPKRMQNNWGILQIDLCANGLNPGSSPSFWISVRMNIHIQQQLKRLGYL